MNIYIKKVDADCLLAEMTLVMTSLLLARVFQCLFTFALIGGNLTAHAVNQEPKGKWRWNSNLRLSKDQVSDAFGVNSTKSRETAGVVVLVFFFPKATRRPTATRAKKIIL